MRGKWMISILALTLVLGLSLVPARAQDSSRNSQHVVSLDDLNSDAAKPAQTRQANEAAVRELLSSERGQKALKSLNVDYQRVDKAIGQLSDDDLAKVAERSRQTQQDFAAGGLGATWLIAIALIIVLIIVLAIVF